MALTSYPAYGRLSNRSCCGAAFVRWLWRRLSERGASLLGAHPLAPESVGTELADAVLLAAAADIRVVIGDRDLLRTVGRAWDALGFSQRTGLLLEFGLCTLLPTRLAMRIFAPPPKPGAVGGGLEGGPEAGHHGGPQEEAWEGSPLFEDGGGASPVEHAQGGAPEEAGTAFGAAADSGSDETGRGGASPPRAGAAAGAGRASDAMTEVLRHFERRYPAMLGGLAAELEDFAASTLDRLDAPLADLCPSSPVAEHHRRPLVVAVLGHGTARALEARRRAADPSPEEGGHLWPKLSSDGRRSLARGARPALRAGFLVPLVFAFLVLGVPLVYCAAFFHIRVAMAFTGAFSSIGVFAEDDRAR